MAFILPQRAVLVNRCHPQSLPLTSLRRQQHRSIGIALPRRHSPCSSLVICFLGPSDEPPYERELRILEERREELGLLPGLCHIKSNRWEYRWLDRLKDVIKFYYQEGRVPARGGTEYENSLARWIHNQRRAKQCLDEGKPCTSKMTAERNIILESMSWWVWDALEAAWESKFAELEKYVAKYGEIPPVSHPTLGEWVETQRMAWKAWQAHRNGETDKYTSVNQYMGQERAKKLESLEPWSWEPHEDAWEAKYKQLVEYVHEHKKIPPRSHPTLGSWVKHQREAYRAWKARSNGETEKYSYVNSTMDQGRAKKLEKVPGWKWDMRA